MAIHRDSQDMFMMGYDSGYERACKDWEEKIDKIRDEVESLCVPFMGCERYSEVVGDVLEIIDDIIGKEYN